MCVCRTPPHSLVVALISCLQCLNDADSGYESFCVQCKNQLCADCLNFNSGFTRYFVGFYTYIVSACRKLMPHS